VYAVFALAGVQFAAFAARIPEVKSGLGLTAGELGLTLLAVSAGSLCGLSAAGWLVHRFGAARTTAMGVLAAACGMALAGLALDVAGSRVALTALLLLAGVGIGSWDVAMNIEGAAVEQVLGQSIMPRFHAAFSGGTVLSALAGAGASRAGIPVHVHLLVVSVPVLAGGGWAVGRFLPRTTEGSAGSAGRAGRAGREGEPGSEGVVAEPIRPTAVEPAVTPPRGGAGLRAAWTERRTVLVGCVTLAAAFTEGTANDWLSVAFVEGHGLPPWAGILAFAGFLTAMTVGRLLGTALLDRFGRVPVLRATFALAVLGAGVVVWGGPVLGFAGAALWGLGASLGFPVGMSAAADDPARAPARVSVVSTIGYLAFLGGPPLLGLLGDRVGVLHSLLVVGAMVAVALLAVPAVRESGPGVGDRRGAPTPG